MVEIDLPTDQLNTDNVFIDKRSALSALSNLFINLRESSIYSGNPQGLGTLLSLYTDDLQDLSNSPISDNFLLYNNILDPTRSILANTWSNSYAHIYAINAFIQGVELSSGITNEDKDVLINEAYILRALYYQNLTLLFGDIPYTTTTDYNANTFIKKTSYTDVLKKIEEDLLKVTETISDNYRSNDKYYPNKAVVEILLAKNYLLQKKYTLAETLSRKILSNAQYSLESDLNKVFKKNAKSTLWQLSNSSPTASTYEARNYTILINSWPYRLHPNLLEAFSDDDLRKKNWIKSFLATGDLFAYKYKNIPPTNTDECSVLFRLEEAYFILIESLIYQNNETEAIVYLNIIRQRAGLPALNNTLSKQQVLTAMLEESRKEFFTEHGRRFFDLKRNNMLSILKTIKPNWQDKHALLPYPEKELLINPNLNPQNEY
ncbi:hypothetical protein MPR_1302 [Myroides profundi]|nr:hypothetical protein MPR_1302 [Myroides profundi]